VQTPVVHAPAQLPGEQWLGAGLSEQQFDRHSVSAVHPVHAYSPPSIAHAWPDAQVQPQTPQLVVVVASTAFPPQQRAYTSPVFQFVPSASATAGWQAPFEHFGASWQASGAAPQVVLALALPGVPHTPAAQVGAVWQTSGAAPHALPSFAATGVQVPPMHTGAE